MIRITRIPIKIIMKKSLFLIAIGLISYDVMAQETNPSNPAVNGTEEIEEPAPLNLPEIPEVEESRLKSISPDSTKLDTVEITSGRNRIIIISEEDNNHDVKVNRSNSSYSQWSGFNFGVSSIAFPEGPDDFAYDYLQDQDYWKSIHWSINFYEKRFRVIKDYVQVVTGAGFEFHNYSFNHNKRIGYTEDGGVFGAEDTTFSLLKNRLKTSYFNIPLMLAFNTHNESKKGMHVAVGVIGGVRLGTTYKTKWFEDGNKKKVNTKGHHHMNDFSASATARIGFGRGLNVYANYNLIPMFDTDKGPEVNQFTVGVRLIPFF